MFDGLSPYQLYGNNQPNNLCVKLLTRYAKRPSKFNVRKDKMFDFFKAGIASREFPEQLLIALEPEAASIYIRKLRMHQFVPDDTPAFSRNTVRREHGLFSSTLSDQSAPILLDPERCLCFLLKMMFN